MQLAPQLTPGTYTTTAQQAWSPTGRALTTREGIMFFLKPAAAKHIFRTGNVFSSGGAWPKRNVATGRRSTIHVVRLPSELDKLALVLGLDPKRVAAGLVWKKLSPSRLCSSSRRKIHWTQLRFYESGHGHARTRSLVVDNGVRARVASTFKLSVQVVWNQWI